MTLKTKNLLNGILSLFLLVPLPTLIIHVFKSLQETGCVIIFNKIFAETGSYIILAILVLFTLYLLHKSLQYLGRFLLAI